MPDRIKVLVADESRSVRLLLASLLRNDGRFDVVADVASGAAIRQHVGQVDLVVLDLVLEDGDGFSVIEDIRASAPGVAAVIVATVAPPYLRDEAAARGADAFFTHSMEPAALLDGFAAAVDRAATR